jgi:hypothetical protein
MFLWDQIAYAAPSARRVLAVAIKACGLSDHRPAGIRLRSRSGLTDSWVPRSSRFRLQNEDVLP